MIRFYSSNIINGEALKLNNKISLRNLSRVTWKRISGTQFWRMTHIELQTISQNR